MDGGAQVGDVDRGHFVWFYGLLALLAAAVLLRPRRGSWKLLLKSEALLGMPTAARRQENDGY